MPHEKCNSTESGGFTLVEIMIAAAIFTTVILTITSALSFIRRTFRKSDFKSTAINDIERFVLRLDGELSSALDIIVPLADEKSSRLRFTCSEGSEIEYAFSDDGEVTRTDLASKQKRVLMKNITELSFARFSRGLVQIIVSMGDKTDRVSILSAIHVWNLP